MIYARYHHPLTCLPSLLFSSLFIVSAASISILPASLKSTSRTTLRFASTILLLVCDRAGAIEHPTMTPSALPFYLLPAAVLMPLTVAYVSSEEPSLVTLTNEPPSCPSWLYIAYSSHPSPPILALSLRVSPTPMLSLSGLDREERRRAV